MKAGLVMAKKMASYSLQALCRIKKAVNSTYADSFEDGIKVESELSQKFLEQRM